LLNLLTNHEYRILQGPDNPEIVKITYNSRNVIPGSLFVCLKGFTVDGHKYAQSAIFSGAAALLVEDEISGIPDNITVIRVRNTRKTLAYVSAQFFGNPAKSMTMVGITGTFGKTGITKQMKSLLEYAGKVVGTIGTIGSFVGNTKIDVNKNTVTTPNSLELHEILYKMKNYNAQIAIMEVTSHALVQNRVDYCNYDVGIFTNIYENHLDFHKTMENYKLAKLKLFEQSDVAVINMDSELSSEIINKSKTYISYGIYHKADIMASDIIFMDKKINCTISIFGKIINISFDGENKFELENLLSAIATCYLLGVDENIIFSWLKQKSGVMHCIQKIPQIINK